jgi:hypothetical protein
MRIIIRLIILSAAVFTFTSCEIYSGYMTEGFKEYSLRDRGPAGGWIFHIADNGDGTRTYYEAALADQAVEVEWINAGVSPNPQETENGNTDTVIGSGWSNTMAIISQENHTSSAAQLCRDYRGGGMDDWFLPSQDELERMCWNLRGITYDSVINPEVPGAAGGGVGNWADHYWSSSEFGQYNARFQQFFNGYQTFLPKSNLRNVRAIRAFTY